MGHQPPNRVTHYTSSHSSLLTLPVPKTHNMSNLTESGITIPSDSENYDANNELSSSSPPTSSSTSSPLILYKPPTVWGLLRGAAINLLLPFINGLMLGFGELVANEAAFRLGWSGTKVRIHSFFFHHVPFRSISIMTNNGRTKKGNKGLTIRHAGMNRSFQPIDQAPLRGEWDPAWKCALIPSNGGGETGRN